MSKFRELMESIMKESSEWVIMLSDTEGTNYVVNEREGLSTHASFAKKFPTKDEAWAFAFKEFDNDPAHVHIINHKTGKLTWGATFVIEYDELVKHMR